MPIIRMPDGQQVRFPDDMPKEQIKGMIASKFPDFANQKTPQLKMTDEQKAQAQQKAKEYREQVKPRTIGDAVSDFAVTHPIGRSGGFFTQGVANSGLNPFRPILEAYGMDMKPLGEPERPYERVSELAGEYGTDAAIIYELLANAAPVSLGVSKPTLTGNVINELTKGGLPFTLTGSTGSALATGIINPESTVGRMATDILGGGLGAGLTRPKFRAPKQDVKTVKELTKSIGEDALNRDIAEAERTGRNLLEVGGDEVMQAAQQARQQSPEARKIITDTLESSIAEQPTRTRGVINEALGTKGKNATIAQVMKNAKAEAQPIYKEIENMGDLAAYETKDIPEQNFKRWFEGSQVVDENGQPLKLYHGTNADFDVFDKSKIGTRTDSGLIGSGFYFHPDLETTKSYGHIIKPVYLNAKKIFDFNNGKSIRQTIDDMGIEPVDIFKNAKEEEARRSREITKWLQNNGYDGAKVWDQYVVFEPNQIKSVNNSGAWSSSPSLSDAGWKPESQLANVVKNNDVVNDAIKSVKRSYSSYKNMSDTDPEVLIKTHSVLSKQTTSLDPTKAFEAREALKELDPILNNITGGKLAQANKLYSDAYQFERAADLGRDVFNSRKSPDDLKTAWNSLSSTEKQAAKIGLREEVMNKIGSATNETNALNRFLPENVREKIMTIAGNKEGGRIIDEAEQAVKLRRNYNKLTSGSQTSEKQSLRDALSGIRGFVSHPLETTVDALAKPFDTQRNIRMAEYLTENPASLKDAFSRVNMANRLNAERMPRRIPYLQSALRAIIEEK